MTYNTPYIVRVKSLTESQWAILDPILQKGEPGYISDTNMYKIGDGITKFSELPFATGIEGPVGPPGPGALVDEGDVDFPPADLLPGEFLYDPDAEPDPSYSPLTQDVADVRYLRLAGDNSGTTVLVNDNTYGDNLHLKTDVGRSGLHWFNTVASADNRRIRLVMYQTGQLYFQRVTESGYDFSPSTLPILVVDTPIEVGAPAALRQVPRLARTPNPATGDLGLPGYAGSDTGWRDMAGELIGVTPTVEQNVLRRSGNMVELLLSVDTTGLSGAVDLVSIPPGFRGSRGQYGLVSLYPVKDGFASYSWNPMRMSGYNATTHQRIRGNWLTDEAWPSSLPGTQKTAPATWS